MSGAQIDKGSFRDPAGRVCQIDNRIFRLLSPEGLTQFRQIKDKAFWKKALECSSIVNTREIPLEDYKDKIRNIPFETAAILEHEKVPFVSYPFEWPFRLLKRAALLHLDLQLAALKDDVNVSDGTAFNVQFVGSKPVFIDVLSFRPYSNGDYWDGYSQFCSSFLGPMLLSTYRNIPFGHIYRGNLTGIPVEVISQLLPLRSHLKFAALVHIHLQAHLARRLKANGTSSTIAAQRSKPLPKKSLVGLITSLRRVVGKLTEKGVTETVWSDYESNNSYSDEESQLKLKLVTDYANTYKPSLLLDIGCNTGRYSEAALAAGAGYVVGFDSDAGALDKAVLRSDSKDLRFLPLYMDVSNPTPNLGWFNAERKSLFGRANSDGVIALAIIHHLAIAQNVPLSEVTDWLISLGSSGVVEFVPKGDPMVQILLANRPDIFPNYNYEHFRSLLDNRARIVSEQQISASGRMLVVFETNTRASGFE